MAEISDILPRRVRTVLEDLSRDRWEVTQWEIMGRSESVVARLHFEPPPGEDVHYSNDQIFRDETLGDTHVVGTPKEECSITKTDLSGCELNLTIALKSGEIACGATDYSWFQTSEDLNSQRDDPVQNRKTESVHINGSEEEHNDELLASVENLSEKLSQRSESLTHLKETATEVTSAVSSHDAELVNDHVSALERKQADLEQMLGHRLQGCQQVASTYDVLMKDVVDFSEWLRDTDLQVKRSEPMGATVEEGEVLLQEHFDIDIGEIDSYDEVDLGAGGDADIHIEETYKASRLDTCLVALIRDIESKQAMLDAIRRQGDSLLRDLSPAERALIESKITELANDHRRIANEANLRHKDVARELAQREALQQDINRALSWIAEKEEVVNKTGNIRLKSSDIEKEVDKYKTLQAEIAAYSSTIKQVQAQTDKLLAECSSQEKKPIEDKLSDISNRYSALRAKLEDTIARNQRALSARKQFESDVLRLELWRKETELTCSSELQLDCPLDFLDEQHKKHLSLDEGTRTFESVVKDLSKRAETLVPDVSDADKTTLSESLSTLREDFYRVAVLVRKRVKQLSDALAAKSKMEGELLACSRWLYDMQDELRRLSRTIGHRQEDAHVMLDQAQHLSETMDAYKKTMDELSAAAEQAKAIGQPTAAEEVARLNTLYGEMQEQVQAQQTKLEAAVALREAYYAAKAEMETCLKTCHEQLEAVSVLGVSVPTKLDRYKTVIDTLNSKTPVLALIDDKGQQIGIEGTPSDSRAIREQVTALKVKAENLKRRAEREASELNKVMSERSEFDSELSEHIEWLKQKETEIDARDILGLSPESIEKELDQYYDDRHGLFARLQAVHEQVQEQKARYEQLEEAIPLEVQDRMDEFEVLREILLDKLKAKGEYLNTAKEERVTYNSAWRIIIEWLKNADAQIKPNFEGINFDSVQDQLQQHKAMFADQPMIAEKLEQLLHLAKKIEPTLDVNDSTTMKESLGNMQQRYGEVTKAAAEKDDWLSKAADDWTEYQTNLTAIDKILKTAEERWENAPDMTPSNIHDAQRQIADVEDYMCGLSRYQNDIDALNNAAQELDENASVPSQTVIERTIRNVNERWNVLGTKAVDKQNAMKDTVSNWSEYVDIIQSLTQVLEQVDKRIGTDAVEGLPTEKLAVQLQDTHTAKELLEASRNDVGVLQKSAQSVLSKLPPSEAKVAIQKETLQLQDEYEHLEWRCNEHQKNLESEAVDRQRFSAEVQDVASELSLANESLTPNQLLPLDVGDVEKKLTEKEELRKSIALRLQQVQPVIESQTEKYADESNLPQDLLEQVRNLRGLETQVSDALKACTEAIGQAKSVRTEYNTELLELSTTLEAAENQLDNPSLTMEDGKKLIAELDGLAPKFDRVQELATSIAATLPPEQHEFLQAEVDQVHSHWEQLYGNAGDKMEELAEVAELRDRFEQDAAVVNTWVEHAKRVTNTELVWTNLHSVQTQLSEYRTLVAKSAPVQGRLEEMAQLADRLASQEGTEQALNRVSEINKSYDTIHEEIASRLNLLEEASVQYISYASEVESVAKWMGQARQAFNAAQRANSLREQLSLQEALVKDIELHESRVKAILTQHEKLRALSGNLAPTHQGEQLATEINDLKMAAIHRKDELASALEQQESYEKQVTEISKIITNTRATLEVAPPPATTVEGLQQQITDHNELTAKVLASQKHIDQINEKNRELLERMQNLSPAPTGPLLEELNIDIESGSESGSVTTPTLSTISSRSSVSPAFGLVMERKDSGVMMTPEGTNISSAPGSVNGHYYGAEVSPESLFRSSSPLDTISMRSDDTEYLLAQAQQSLDANSSDTSTLVSDESGSTAILLKAPNGNYTSHVSSDSSNVPLEQNGRSVVPTIAVSLEGPSSDDTSLMGVTEDLSDITLRSSEVFGSFEEGVTSGEGGDVTKPHYSPEDITPGIVKEKAQQQMQGSLTGYNASVEEISEHQLDGPALETKPTTHSGDVVDSQEESTSGYVVRLIPGDGENFSQNSQSPRTLSVATPCSTNQSLCSEFVAIPNIQEVLLRGRPDSTDLSMSMSLSMSHTSTSSIKELNSSWSSLQAQLSQRSLDLNVALENQEKFQQAVQGLMQHMDDVTNRLENLAPATTLEGVRSQLQDLQGLKQEVGTLQEHVASVAEQGEALMISTDPEGHPAMRTTLQMLTDKLHALRDQYTDTDTQLQAVLEERERHAAALYDYQAKVEDNEAWLTAAKAGHGAAPLLSQDVASLDQQLQETQTLIITPDTTTTDIPPENALTNLDQVSGLRLDSEEKGSQTELNVWNSSSTTEDEEYQTNLNSEVQFKEQICHDDQVHIASKSWQEATEDESLHHIVSLTEDGKTLEIPNPINTATSATKTEDHAVCMDVEHKGKKEDEISMQTEDTRTETISDSSPGRANVKDTDIVSIKAVKGDATESRTDTTVDDVIKTTIEEIRIPTGNEIDDSIEVEGRSWQESVEESDSLLSVIDEEQEQNISVANVEVNVSQMDDKDNTAIAEIPEIENATSKELFVSDLETTEECSQDSDLFRENVAMVEPSVLKAGNLEHGEERLVEKLSSEHAIDGSEDFESVDSRIRPKLVSHDLTPEDTFKLKEEDECLVDNDQEDNAKSLDTANWYETDIIEDVESKSQDISLSDRSKTEEADVGHFESTVEALQDNLPAVADLTTVQERTEHDMNIASTDISVLTEQVTVESISHEWEDGSALLVNDNAKMDILPPAPSNEELNQTTELPEGHDMQDHMTLTTWDPAGEDNKEPKLVSETNEDEGRNIGEDNLHTVAGFTAIQERTEHDMKFASTDVSVRTDQVTVESMSHQWEDEHRLLRNDDAKIETLPSTASSEELNQATEQFVGHDVQDDLTLPTWDPVGENNEEPKSEYKTNEIENNAKTPTEHQYSETEKSAFKLKADEIPENSKVVLDLSEEVSPTDDAYNVLDYAEEISVVAPDQTNIGVDLSISNNDEGPDYQYNMGEIVVKETDQVQDDSSICRGDDLNKDDDTLRSHIERIPGEQQNVFELEETDGENDLNISPDDVVVNQNDRREEHLEGTQNKIVASTDTYHDQEVKPESSTIESVSDSTTIGEFDSSIMEQGASILTNVSEMKQGTEQHPVQERPSSDTVSFVRNATDIIPGETLKTVLLEMIDEGKENNPQDIAFGDTEKVSVLIDEHEGLSTEFNDAIPQFEAAEFQRDGSIMEQSRQVAEQESFGLIEEGPCTDTNQSGKPLTEPSQDYQNENVDDNVVVMHGAAEDSDIILHEQAKEIDLPKGEDWSIGTIENYEDASWTTDWSEEQLETNVKYPSVAENERGDSDLPAVDKFSTGQDQDIGDTSAVLKEESSFTDTYEVDTNDVSYEDEQSILSNLEIPSEYAIEEEMYGVAVDEEGDIKNLSVEAPTVENVEGKELDHAEGTELESTFISVDVSQRENETSTADKFICAESSEEQAKVQDQVQVLEENGINNYPSESDDNLGKDQLGDAEQEEHWYDPSTHSSEWGTEEEFAITKVESNEEEKTVEKTANNEELTHKKTSETHVVSEEVSSPDTADDIAITEVGADFSVLDLDFVDKVDSALEKENNYPEDSLPLSDDMKKDQPTDAKHGESVDIPSSQGPGEVAKQESSNTKLEEDGEEKNSGNISGESMPMEIPEKSDMSKEASSLDTVAAPDENVDYIALDKTGEEMEEQPASSGVSRKEDALFDRTVFNSAQEIVADAVVADLDGNGEEICYPATGMIEDSIYATDIENRELERPNNDSLLETISEPTDLGKTVPVLPEEAEQDVGPVALESGMENEEAGMRAHEVDERENILPTARDTSESPDDKLESTLALGPDAIDMDATEINMSTKEFVSPIDSVENTDYHTENFAASVDPIEMEDAEEIKDNESSTVTKPEILDTLEYESPYTEAEDQEYTSDLKLEVKDRTIPNPVAEDELSKFTKYDMEGDIIEENLAEDESQTISTDDTNVFESITDGGTLLKQSTIQQEDNSYHLDGDHYEEATMDDVSGSELESEMSRATFVTSDMEEGKTSEFAAQDESGPGYIISARDTSDYKAVSGEELELQQSTVQHEDDTNLDSAQEYAIKEDGNDTVTVSALDESSELGGTKIITESKMEEIVKNILSIGESDEDIDHEEGVAISLDQEPGISDTYPMEDKVTSSDDIANITQDNLPLHVFSEETGNLAKQAEFESLESGVGEQSDVFFKAESDHTDLDDSAMSLEEETTAPEEEDLHDSDSDPRNIESENEQKSSDAKLEEDIFAMPFQAEKFCDHYQVTSSEREVSPGDMGVVLLAEMDGALVELDFEIERSESELEDAVKEVDLKRAPIISDDIPAGPTDSNAAATSDGVLYQEQMDTGSQEMPSISRIRDQYEFDLSISHDQIDDGQNSEGEEVTGALITDGTDVYRHDTKEYIQETKVEDSHLSTIIGAIGGELKGATGAESITSEEGTESVDLETNELGDSSDIMVDRCDGKEELGHDILVADSATPVVLLSEDQIDILESDELVVEEGLEKPSDDVGTEENAFISDATSMHEILPGVTVETSVTKETEECKEDASTNENYVGISPSDSDPTAQVSEGGEPNIDPTQDQGSVRKISQTELEPENLSIDPNEQLPVLPSELDADTTRVVELGTLDFQDQEQTYYSQVEPESVAYDPQLEEELTPNDRNLESNTILSEYNEIEPTWQVSTEETSEEEGPISKIIWSQMDEGQFSEPSASDLELLDNSEATALIDEAEEEFRETGPAEEYYVADFKQPENDTTTTEKKKEQGKILTYAEVVAARAAKSSSPTIEGSSDFTVAQMVEDKGQASDSIGSTDKWTQDMVQVVEKDNEISMAPHSSQELHSEKSIIEDPDKNDISVSEPGESPNIIESDVTNVEWEEMTDPHKETGWSQDQNTVPMPNLDELSGGDQSSIQVNLHIREEKEISMESVSQLGEVDNTDPSSAAGSKVMVLDPLTHITTPSESLQDDGSTRLPERMDAIESPELSDVCEPLHSDPESNLVANVHTPDNSTYTSRDDNMPSNTILHTTQGVFDTTTVDPALREYIGEQVLDDSDTEPGIPVASSEYPQNVEIIDSDSKTKSGGAYAPEVKHESSVNLDTSENVPSDLGVGISSSTNLLLDDDDDDDDDYDQSWCRVTHTQEPSPLSFIQGQHDQNLAVHVPDPSMSVVCVSEQEVQRELPERLQQLSDLAVTAEQLAALESPEEGATIQSQIASLRDDTEQFAMGMAQKSDQLNVALKDAERKKKEVEECKRSIVNLQQWIDEHRSLGPLSSADTVDFASQQEPETRLEIAEHTTLLSAVADGPQRGRSSDGSENEDDCAEGQVKKKWRRLSKQLSDRKAELLKVRDADRPQAFSGQPMSYYRSALQPYMHDSDQYESIEHSLQQLMACWEALQSQVSDKEARLEQTLLFHRLYQESITRISTWLDDVQLRLFNTALDTNTDERLKENDALQKEMDSLHSRIDALGTISQHLASEDSADSKLLIKQILKDLLDRLCALEAQAQLREQELLTRDRSWHEYENTLLTLKISLSEIRQQLTATIHSMLPLEDQLGEIESMQEKLRTYEIDIEELTRSGELMVTMDTNNMLPLELSTMQSHWAELHDQVSDRRMGILAAMELQSQYEKLLAEFAEFLETAQSKLTGEETPSTLNLHDLRQQLDAHKEFFSDLESHRALLDAMAHKVAPPTYQRFERHHTNLISLTHVIEDKASLHGQRLERAVSQWHDFEQHFDSARECLHRLEQQQPSKASNEEDLEHLRRKIWNYHTIQGALTEEKASMYQCVDKGKQLLQKMVCPSLEADVADFSEQLLRINNDTNTELKRLETLVDQWETFEREASAFEQWLTLSNQQLTRISAMDNLDLQNISAIKCKIDNFLEFRKEVEAKQPLKTKVSMLGQQLLRARPADTRLRERLDQIETDWLRLMCDLPNNEEALHSAQMELLPSRQALGELGLWMNAVEATLRDDNRDYCSLLDVQMALEKYRGLKVDLGNKQLTVDFVNQSSMQSTEGLADTDFSEKLGSMNSRYQSISSDIAEQLRNLELLQVKWEEYDRALNNLRNWFSDHEAEVKKFQRIGHEVSVTHAVHELKELQDELKIKEGEIDSVKVIGTGLADSDQESPAGSRILADNIEQLNNSWAKIDHEVYQLLNTLEDVLEQWQVYNDALLKVQSTLTETDYALLRYTCAAGDIPTFTEQLKQLKTLQKELDNRQEDLDKLTACGSELAQVCEPVIGQATQRTTHDADDHWHDLGQRLDDRIAGFEDTLDQWEAYDKSYKKAKSWVQERGDAVNALIRGMESGLAPPEHLTNAKDLQNELEFYQPHLTALARLSGQLAPSMDNITVVHMTATETALRQDMTGLENSLSKHVKTAQNALEKYNKFREALDVVQRFINDAESQLKEADSSASVEVKVLHSRMEALQNLLQDFRHTQSTLDDLNSMGYRLPLNKQDTSSVKDLNSRWQGALSVIGERYRHLQAQLLLQQDFHEKCSEWGKFLAQVEKDLSSEIPGNYKGLLDQKKAFELFQTEMYGRQQILHAIVKEGQQMVSEGDVEDQVEFEQKLLRLEEQWRNVLARANQKKTRIDTSIGQWHAYKNQLDRMNSKVDEMEDMLDSLEFAQAPVQKIKSLLDNVKSLYSHLKEFNVTACVTELQQMLVCTNSQVPEMGQREVAASEPIYQQLTNLGRELQSMADPGARREIHGDLQTVQERWFNIIHSLEQRREELENMMGEWSDAEAGIEDVLTWLREMRIALGHELPDNYDQLQRELQQCKEFESSFSTSNDKRTNLAAHEEVLAAIVAPEDLTVLRQRLRLLNKQWEEIRQQVLTRQQRIQERLARWTTFGDQHKDMLEWMSNMETKVSAGHEFHIEDLLSKLKDEYKNEVAAMAVERDQLISRGQRLMAGSSEVRANDIEYKIKRLLDKWQRLEDMMATRQKKLQETLVAVQQLETNMSGLRRWLAYIEHELSSPILFHHPDMPEIQTKLQHHQELQKDVEKHSAGVASVLNLCEVLLHDHDACPSDAECSAIEQAMSSLDKRWRNICSMVSDRRMRIEETWELWQHFHDDHLRFDEWLRNMERQTRSPPSIDPTYEAARDEIKNFEVTTRSEQSYPLQTFQREVHANISQLENLNRQYRKLAREGRTDTAGTLKKQVENVNQRWDKLVQTTTAIVRRLRHTINVKDDFDATRQALTLWLNDLEVQISNLEAFPGNEGDRMKKVKAITADYDKNSHRFEYIEKAGLYLMQKSEPSDSVNIENDLRAFKKKHSEVKERLDKLQSQPTKSEPLQTNGFSHDCLPEIPQEIKKSATYVVHFKPRKGSPTKTTAGAEWDLYDVKQVVGDELDAADLSSPELASPPSEQESEAEEEVEVKQTAVKVSSKPASAPLWEAVLQALANKSTAKRLEVEGYLRDLELAMENTEAQLSSAERTLKSATPVGPETESSTGQYSKLVQPIQENVDVIHNLEKLIREEMHITNLGNTGEKRLRAVVKRWQTVNTQAIEKDYRLDQKRHQWSQFSSDLKNILAWLDTAETIVKPQTAAPPDIKELEAAILKHKEFSVVLENKKPIVLSINLLSKAFLQPGAPHAAELKGNLTQMNERFDRLCVRTIEWQNTLQKGLIASTDFVRTVEEMKKWMDGIDKKLEDIRPVNVRFERDVLMAKYMKLKDMRKELDVNQARAITLHDIAYQMPASERTRTTENAKTELATLSDRIKSGLKSVLAHMAKIESTLNIKRSPSPLRLGTEASGAATDRIPSIKTIPRFRSRSSLFSRQPLDAAAAVGDSDDSEQDLDNSAEHEVDSRRRFLTRVLRTAVPLQMMLLLLLGVACLVPMSEEDFSCVLANNFKRSLDPMLRYTDGPPPF